ncbi:hypothetical protein [Microbacterium aurum]
MADAIDIVVLWVDVTDQEWQRRRQAAGAAPQQYVGATHDWEMLRYLLRGIDQYCPWVRRVHLVTPGQTPSWLDPTSDDIVVVDQDALLPAGQGPSFNSMAIEVNLDRIPGLAERFVYFNDDMLVVKPTRADDVFPGGMPAGFAIQNAITGSSAWSHWVLNAVGIVDRAFDKRAVMRRRPLQWFSPRYGRHLLRNVALLPWTSFTGFFEPHLPMALERRTFAEVRDAAPQVIARTSAATFRTLDCVIPFVYRYWCCAPDDSVRCRLTATAASSNCGSVPSTRSNGRSRNHAGTSYASMTRPRPMTRNCACGWARRWSGRSRAPHVLNVVTRAPVESDQRSPMIAVVESFGVCTRARSDISPCSSRDGGDSLDPGDVTRSLAVGGRHSTAAAAARGRCMGGRARLARQRRARGGAEPDQRAEEAGARLRHRRCAEHPRPDRRAHQHGRLADG